MSNCPVCDAPVKGDFGLTECEQCGAQLLVHVDGRVEYSGNQTGMSRVEEALPPVPGEDGQVFDFENAEDSPSEEPVLGPPAAEDAFEEQPEFSSDEAAEPAQPESLFDEEPAPDPLAADPVPNEAEPEAYKSPQTSASPDLSDIAKFGNSENLARDGSLRYNLFISGIDTVDVREAFREALTDRKFVWDIEQILRSIRHGEVRITNVTPVKAYILISRLRGLPVQVKWEQYAIHQA